MDIKNSIKQIAQNALLAARNISRVTSAAKNNALLQMADELDRNCDFLLAENAKDVSKAKKSGLPHAMIDRLTLKKATIESMAQGLREVARSARSRGQNNFHVAPSQRSFGGPDAYSFGSYRHHL